MILLQPTTFCNLDCTYCYLTEREKSIRMQPAIATAVATYIVSQSRRIRIAWHGGEPLAAGLDHFRMLHAPLSRSALGDRVRHNVQTNGTLIDDDWCEFFADERFEVGISIDGPAWMNRRRTFRDGRESFAAVSRGIEALHAHHVPFATLAVITDESLQCARDLYRFTKSIGSRCLCVNVEEYEGNNRTRLRSSDRVTAFWEDLFEAWHDDPSPIKVREIDKTLSAMTAVLEPSRTLESRPRARRLDIFPSISARGDVVVLSPELMQATPNSRYDFVVGNILDVPLSTIVESAPTARYVQDFEVGVSRCAKECEYFDVCEGGQASNKFFEHGDLRTTSTDFCRNHKQRLADAILNCMENRRCQQ